MPADASPIPWMNAWLAVQRDLSRLAEWRPRVAHENAQAGAEPPAEAMRRLLEFGNDYAGIAADCWRQLQGGEPDLGGLRAGLVERYQRLFMPVIGPHAGAANPLASSAAFVRCQLASQRFGRHAAAIAIDAFERLSASLATNDPAASPVTSLRQLHELWIECGEAAYAAHAHGDEFADAQAELLASHVELRFEQLRMQEAGAAPAPPTR